jgi:hypothetical protein
MDRQRWAEIESLYQDALERDRTERCVWLQQACGDDTDLLREVESLLACADANLSNPDVRQQMDRLCGHLAEDQDSSMRKASLQPVDMNIPGAGTTAALPFAIGRYRILRLLSEGGMGVVYEAEQEQPRRRVALKVIKPGLADPKSIRRFEHESRAKHFVDEAGMR